VNTAEGAAEPTRLRRDAAANRERLLQAAREVFGEQGLDVGVDVVARRAGVGMGTLYRRFPTKEALIAELAGSLLTELIDLAEQALSTDAATGLEDFLYGSGALFAAQSGCVARLWLVPSTEARIGQLRRLVQRLVERAQQAGTVRQDLAPTDVTVLLWALRGIIETVGPVDARAWRRHVEIVLAGCRPSVTPLSSPALSSEDLGALDRVRRHGAVVSESVLPPD
jgi:AcrR family transcriptional regulator